MSAPALAQAAASADAGTGPEAPSVAGLQRQIDPLKAVVAALQAQQA